MSLLLITYVGSAEVKRLQLLSAEILGQLGCVSLIFARGRHYAPIGLYARLCHAFLVHFLQDGGRPPSWICGAHFGTTHREYLEFFITVQDLFGIAAVALIIWKFKYFAHLA